jgi:hypothetical protein
MADETRFEEGESWDSAGEAIGKAREAARLQLQYWVYSDLKGGVALHDIRDGRKVDDAFIEAAKQDWVQRDAELTECFGTHWLILGWPLIRELRHLGVADKEALGSLVSSGQHKDFKMAVFSKVMMEHWYSKEQSHQ